MATAQDLYDRPSKSVDCPICKGQLNVPFDLDSNRMRQTLDCRGCGMHELKIDAYRSLRSLPDKVSRAKLAHAIFKRPSGDTITSDELENMMVAGELPTALELIDNLLLHMAAYRPPGGTMVLLPRDLIAPLGALDDSSTKWAVAEALELGYLAANSPGLFTMRRSGWERHAALLRDGARSEHAFMAMDFNHPELWDLFTNHLRPAVKSAGFDLRTTNHTGKIAGLIDNRMRVEVRTARFVVCDLTHSNRGAYWEAGFAEGIGRPVFYICRKAERESTDKAVRPHFDTAHQTIIAWDRADPGPAMRELVDMIRATLPGEAKMKD